MLLAEPNKYIDPINAIKKDIANMPLELKKNLMKKILFYKWIANGMRYDHIFEKSLNSHSRKLTEGI